MNPDWQAFLAARAVSSDRRGTYVGLADVGLLKVEGEDAAAFLQGQSTCDVKSLAPGRSIPGAFCTPQGRVMADFQLYRGDTGFYVILAAELAERMRKHLQGFVIRSKVVLSDLTPAWGAIGLLDIGPVDTGLVVPEEPGAGLEQANQVALRLEGGRTLILAETAAAEGLWKALEQAAGAPAPAALWRLRAIEAGCPAVVAATSEEFLPQMLNLDALGGVSFNKGCYTGQEIVTRTHFLGQVKRRMFRLRGQGGSVPAPGSAVYLGGGTEAKEAGQVVVAAPETDGAFQALAVLGLDYVLAGNLHFLVPAGPPAVILDLPYSLQTA